MAKKKSLFQEFTKGILVENPVLRLVLGTCPTLAVSTSVESALGMGVAASIVLVCSNIAIAALKKVIPQKVRIPAYIVIIASFVTIVQMLVKAFVPQIDAQLGVYLPLIVVNCIILGRAEAFACKNSVAASAVDGLGMGVGFTAAPHGRSQRAARHGRYRRTSDNPGFRQPHADIHSASRRLLRLRHTHGVRQQACRQEGSFKGGAQGLRGLPDGGFLLPSRRS